MADLVALPPSLLDKHPWDRCLAPLNNELWQRFRWFVDECKAAFGIDQYAFSAVRAYDEQVNLRRMNCGSSFYDVYRKPASMCSPVTALPGTSPHEVRNPTIGGEAIDLGYGYNDVRGDMKALARKCGLAFTVSSEDWHIQLALAPRPSIPDRYVTPGAYIPITPPVQEEEPVYFQELLRDPRPGKGGAVYLVTVAKNPPPDNRYVRMIECVHITSDPTIQWYVNNPQGPRLSIRDANEIELSTMVPNKSVLDS